MTWANLILLAESNFELVRHHFLKIVYSNIMNYFFLYVSTVDHGSK